MDVNRRKVETILIPFSSLLVLENEHLSQQSTKLCLKKIESDNELVLKEERVMAYNFISILKWTLGDEKGATEFCDKALNENRRNITALSNKSMMLYRNGQYAQSEKLSNSVQELSKDSLYVLNAEHEIAFCYSRLGIRFYHKAIELFDKVVTRAQNITFPSETEKKSFLTLSMFGLGLCHRRLSNTSNTHKVEEQSTYVERIQKSSALFHDLIQHTDNATYKGRALVQLGEMAILSQSGEKIIHYFPEAIKCTNPWEFYQQAYEAAPRDVFVLERCGKYFRICKNLELAETCLKTAISIRPTSFAHHHLALLLKTKLTKDVEQMSGLRYTPFHDFKSTNMGNFRQSQSIRQRENTRYRFDEDFRQNVALRNSNYDPRNKSQKANLTKSPRVVSQLPDDVRTEEIFRHLDKAIELSRNTAAMYDKGLLFRAVGKFTDAKETFIAVCRCEETSEVYLANSYEQYAFCILEEMTYLEHNKDMESNAIQLLMNSVEITTSIASKRPSYHRSWSGLTELKDILKEKGDEVEHLLNLSETHERVGEFGEAFDCYQKVLDMDPENRADPEIYKKMIHNRLKLFKYGEAIRLLNLLRITNKEQIDTCQYLTANVRGAFDCFRSGDITMARSRLRRAFDYHKGQQLPSSDANDTELFDVYILSYKEHPEARGLWKLLKEHCHLSVSMNEDDCLPGAIRLSELSNILERSCHFVICLDENGAKCVEFNFHAGMILSRDRGKQNAILLKDPGLNTELKLHFQTLPMMDFAQDVDMSEVPNTEVLLNWAEKFIFKLLLPDAGYC